MTTISDVLALTAVPAGAPRKEALLIEDEEVPYQWFVEHHFVDLEVPQLSFPYLYAIPGPCGKRKAVWLAWELGFDVLPRPKKGGGRPD